MFPYLEHIENIADRQSQPPPAPLPRMEIYPSTGALLRDFIAEPWEHDAAYCLGTTIQDTPYYLFATCEKHKYIQCGIKQNRMNTDYDKVLKEESIALRCPSFKIGDVVQKLMASIPDDQAVGEWELHTIKDMRWNDNHQRPSKH
jgi:hypothetical protein